MFALRNKTAVSVHAKRMVRVTPKGVQAASDFYSAVTSVSRGVSWATKRVGSET